MDKMKFKLLVYNILGFTFSFILQAIFTYNIVCKNILPAKMDTGELLLNLGGVLLMDILITAIVLIIAMMVSFSTKNDVTFFGYLEYLLFFSNNTKIVNHSKLGKFMLYIEPNNEDNPNKVYIYDVGFLHLRCIDFFFLQRTSGIENLTYLVNHILDNECEKREKLALKKASSKKTNTHNIDYIKDWDGYLDVAGKRDDKIDKILKN